jgi:class 3 adenylate cyclase
MNGELKQEDLKQVRKLCEEEGIVPVINPANEDLRLTELKRLGMLEKNLEQDPRYASLTEVATYLTECPYCAINILGSTVQRCKIIFGLSKEEEKDFQRDSPRDLSICQFSLTNPHQPLVIENLLVDERTKQKYSRPESSPIRFYAGAPLISSRGFALGTLCVVDETPKSLKHNQIEGLRLLADQIVSLIESEHEAKQPKESETKTDGEPAESSGRYYSSTTILFADIVGFTSKVEHLDPGELLATLNTFFKGFDKIVSKHKVRKVKTIGDAYMCVGGISEQRNSHAKKVCKAALDMLRFVEAVNLQQEVLGKERWELRIGIHSGALIAGTTGNTFDIWGDAVNIAARLESSSEPGKIHISEKTRDYLEGSGQLTPRGEITLKGKGVWNTFFLESLNS